jgi:ATP-dependent DNA helicase RecG
MIHGKLSSEEKEAIMKSFAEKNSAIQILVATTVIEVGIDISDVSICIIDRSHRFGLSQIHQIRGRIGCSSLSFCLVSACFPLSLSCFTLACEG